MQEGTGADIRRGVWQGSNDVKEEEKSNGTILAGKRLRAIIAGPADSRKGVGKKEALPTRLLYAPIRNTAVDEADTQASELGANPAHEMQARHFARYVLGHRGSRAEHRAEEHQGQHVPGCLAATRKDRSFLTARGDKVDCYGSRRADR